jgi:tRNA(adenine34) deaminase
MTCWPSQDCTLVGKLPDGRDYWFNRDVNKSSLPTTGYPKDDKGAWQCFRCLKEKGKPIPRDLGACEYHATPKTKGPFLQPHVRFALVNDVAARTVVYIVKKRTPAEEKAAGGVKKNTPDTVPAGVTGKADSNVAPQTPVVPVTQPAKVDTPPVVPVTQPAKVDTPPAPVTQAATVAAPQGKRGRRERHKKGQRHVTIDPPTNADATKATPETKPVQEAGNSVVPTDTAPVVRPEAPALVQPAKVVAPPTPVTQAATDSAPQGKRDKHRKHGKHHQAPAPVQETGTTVTPVTQAATMETPTTVPAPQVKRGKRERRGKHHQAPVQEAGTTVTPPVVQPNHQAPAPGVTPSAGTTGGDEPTIDGVFCEKQVKLKCWKTVDCTSTDKEPDGQNAWYTRPENMDALPKEGFPQQWKCTRCLSGTMSINGGSCNIEMKQQVNGPFLYPYVPFGVITDKKTKEAVYIVRPRTSGHLRINKQLEKKAMQHGTTPAPVTTPVTNPPVTTPVTTPSTTPVTTPGTTPVPGASVEGSFCTAKLKLKCWPSVQCTAGTDQWWTTPDNKGLVPQADSGFPTGWTCVKCLKEKGKPIPRDLGECAYKTYPLGKSPPGADNLSRFAIVNDATAKTVIYVVKSKSK